MYKNLIASLVAGALALSAVPAGATDWNEKLDLCAQAVDAQGLAVVSNYKVKFVSAGGGATKRLQLRLISQDGSENLTAECKFRRGELSEVTLKS